jgi:hypothetical protein
VRSFCERLCACSGDRSDTDTAGDATATVKGDFCSLALEFAFAFAFDFACNVSLDIGNDSNGANDDEVAATAADATDEATDDDDKVMVDA